MRCYEVTEMYALIDISNQMLAVIGSPSHHGRLGFGALSSITRSGNRLHRRNRRIPALNNES
ncbi:MAG: hypothetical protein WDN69_01655 [Aliidongia sp.]